MKTRLWLCAVLFALYAYDGQAQATRTWVSGVGDDVNPCSRTAPCKTFAGAISKTAAKGEISVLDPGGFGTINITKSITIDGAGTLASILGSGTTGVIINAAATDSVTLRNLTINGGGTGLRGIRILQAKEVHIENCVIFNFGAAPGRGIDINLTSGSTTNVYINNTQITDNAATGVVVLPISGSPIVNLLVADSSVEDSGGSASGLFAGDGARVTAVRSTFSGNTVAGVEAAGNGVVNLDSCVISSNAKGLSASNSASIRITRSSVVQNTTSGFEQNPGTVISTLQDNLFAGNGAANIGAMTPLAPQ
jgi:hypothetical protein